MYLNLHQGPTVRRTCREFRVVPGGQMNVVAMQAGISGAAKAVAPHTSAGAKWGAVGCGLGVLLLLTSLPRL